MKGCSVRRVKRDTRINCKATLFAASHLLLLVLLVSVRWLFAQPRSGRPLLFANFAQSFVT